MLTEHLSEVLSFGEKEAPYLGSDDPVNSEKSVSRMTMRQVLLTGLEEVVQFDKKFTHYEQHSNGTVTAFFEDGTSATGDVLVAADGTNSRVRQQYLPRARLEDCGIVGIAGKVALNPQTKALLSSKILQGVSMVFAPRGYNLILHVMEFKWDQNGVKAKVGTNDTNLLEHWPGLLYDNTRDYIMWAFSAARQNFPSNPLNLEGEALVKLVKDMTPNWHPNLRQLLAFTDLSTVFPINIRTSVPLEPWPTSNVTLLGDAIHTMTPGRGVGANTALRDAALLCRQLLLAQKGEKPLLVALAEYESRMRHYGFEAVLKSLDQMDGNGPLHKPVIGRILLSAMRGGMRVVNMVPALKRKAAASMLYDRNEKEES